MPFQAKIDTENDMRILVITVTVAHTPLRASRVPVV